MLVQPFKDGRRRDHVRAWVRPDLVASSFDRLVDRHGRLITSHTPRTQRMNGVNWLAVTLETIEQVSLLRLRHPLMHEAGDRVELQLLRGGVPVLAVEDRALAVVTRHLECPEHLRLEVLHDLR